MAQELNNNEIDKDKVVATKKRKVTKKENLTEDVKYKPSDGEELIVDKPSNPLKKVTKKVTKNVETKVEVEKVENIVEKRKIKSNKELYQSYINELKYYILTINNEIIYDSSIGKKNTIIFENDFFILFGKKYSYNGLKIQKINKR